jgi:DNA-directed RNA polymerase
VDRNVHKLTSLIKDAATTLELLYLKKEIKRKFGSRPPLIDKDLNKIELLMITFTLAITYYNKLQLTALSVVIGYSILYEIYKNNKANAQKEERDTKSDKNKKAVAIETAEPEAVPLNLRKNESLSSTNSSSSSSTMPSSDEAKAEAERVKEKIYMSYPEFRSNLNFENKDAIKLGYFFISIFAQFPHNLFEIKLESSSFYSREGTTISINPEYLNDIKENIIVHPFTLPMLCPPNIWSDTSVGGYLENESQEEGIITGSSQHKHKVENKDSYVCYPLFFIR